ncbi:MAG: hypothetical protein WKF55_07385 [Gemmatimonadaceae bacterium]
MSEYLLSSLSLLFLSGALLGLTFGGWRIARRRFDVPIIVNLIFFFVIVKVALFYALPTLLRIASDYRFEREDRVAITELPLVYLIEVISWAAWMIALIAVFKIVGKGSRKIAEGDFFYARLAESRILLWVLTLGVLAAIILPLAGRELNPFFAIFSGLFVYAGLAAGPFLMILGLRYYGKALFLLGVISSIFGLLSLATRAAVVSFAMFSIFLSWFVLRQRTAKFVFAGALVLLTAVYFTFGGLITGAFVVDEEGGVAVTTGIASEKKGARSSMEEVEWRFGAATRHGTAFIRMYDRGNPAGFNPIANSLLGFLPRSLNPEKPHPSTLDGYDIYSQGSYLIYREINGHDSDSMVDFPTGGHFYWEFGVAGVLILSAISGTYVALCAHFFSKLGLVALPLMVAVFKPWAYMEPKIWVSDIALQIYQIILPLIFVVSMIRLVRTILRQTDQLSRA